MKTIASGMTLAALLAFGCGGTTSQQKQNQALQHQSNSDTAAEEGRYGTAKSEQRKAQDAHHEAVEKALDNEQTIPAQPKKGDRPAPSPQK